MSEWKEYKLGDIVDVAQGLAINAKTKHLLSDSGLPLLRITDLINNTQVQFVKKDLAPKQTIALEEDIIYTRTGQVGLVFKGKVGVIHNNCFKVIPKDNKVTRNYIYWFLRQSVIKELANSIASGSVQKDLNHSAFKSININVPEIRTQNSITEVLSSLDDKIELNNKINQELESLAQLLFKRWFVDFEFPNENGEPYKSSGGEMVDSELGEIPKGWSVDFLSNLFDFLEGPGLRNWQYRLEGMPFINIRLIQNGDILKNNISFISNEEFEDKYKHFALNENDLVLSTSGTLGKSAIIRKNHLPLMLNTSVIRFRPIQSYYKCFMYQYLQSKIFIDEVKASATGSVQLNFGPMHLKKIKLIKPDDSLIKQFENAFSSEYKQIQKNRDENDELSLLRDTLLPKLISGELQINNN